MGQYGNQPDFITEIVYEGAGSDTIDSTTFLDGAIVYVGDVTNGANVRVIPVGLRRMNHVVDTTITAGGTGYTSPQTGAATIGGSGSGLTVSTTVSAGAVATITVVNPGTGYKKGDIITVDGGNDDATFTVDSTSNLPTKFEAKTIFGCQAGTTLPFVVDYILETGTSAGKLLAGK